MKLRIATFNASNLYSRARDFNGRFPHFPEVTGKVTQASDHAAVWADFDI
jgi:hypothetical protein